MSRINCQSWQPDCSRRVIERPTSVVKKLVENAIDAGSNQIIVEIEESWSWENQITDNGHGMPTIELALRVSTSRLG